MSAPQAIMIVFLTMMFVGGIINYSNSGESTDALGPVLVDIFVASVLWWGGFWG